MGEVKRNFVSFQVAFVIFMFCFSSLTFSHVPDYSNPDDINSYDDYNNGGEDTETEDTEDEDNDQEDNGDTGDDTTTTVEGEETTTTISEEPEENTNETEEEPTNETQDEQPEENTTEEEPDVPTKERAAFREVTSDDIAKDPTINVISSVSIDFSDAIKTRQKRLAEHQEIVRLLAILNEKCGFQLFEGKFDCLGIKGDTALLYEVKTILERATDQEKQTVKGVGQLKYYKFSIVKQQMGLSDISEILVFSRKPDTGIIDFCTAENIAVIWREDYSFQIFNIQTGGDDSFDPDVLLRR